jgi:O-antigen/teichoic acid export membrane protein
MAAESRELIDRPEAGVAALRGSVLGAGGYAVGLLLGLVSAPLVIRGLGIVDFGRYITVLSVVGLINSVAEGGLNALALREYARTSGDERRARMRDLFGMRLALTICAALGAIAFVGVAGYSGAMVLGAIGAAVALVFLAAQNFLQVGLQGDLRFGWATAAELVRQVAMTALIVAAVVAGADLVPLLWVSLPAGILGAAFVAVLVRDRMPLRPSFHLARWAPLLRETLPYAIAAAVGVAYFRATMIVTGFATSAVETGYFATSFRVVEILLGIPTIAVGAAFPILARAHLGDRDRHAQAMRRILELAVIAGALTALSTALAAPFAIDVLAGADFAPSIPILRIQALGLAANFVGVAAGYGLLSAGRLRAIVAVSVVGLASTIALGLTLASAWGAQGAALAIVAGECVLAAGYLAALIRTDPGLRRAAAIIPAVALACAVGASAALLPIPSVVETFVGVVLFLAVLYLLGRFPTEVREVLTARRSRSG